MEEVVDLAEEIHLEVVGAHAVVGMQVDAQIQDHKVTGKEEKEATVQAVVASSNGRLCAPDTLRSERAKPRREATETPKVDTACARRACDRSSDIHKNKLFMKAGHAS